jgi:37-kD nucleoid-associated bacterial protein
MIKSEWNYTVIVRKVGIFMEGYKRIFDVLHHIDLENKCIITKEKGETDLDEYIHSVVTNVLETPDNRHFNFVSETTEVRALIDEIMRNKDNVDKFNEATKGIADRLLREELVAQERYQKITEIKKGSLIQSLIEYNDYHYILIAKVEHESFLNTEDLIKQIGLPFEKKTLKTCLIKINEDDIGDVIVTDTNAKISTYWVKSFLELKELNSDEHNTQMAFNAVDQLLTRNVKKISPPDYTVLRNTLIGYFRSQQNFSMDSMISMVFGEYVPENESIDIEKLKQAVRKLPEQKKFDTHFEIKDKVITAKIKRVVKLSDKIELQLNDHIEQLKNVIKSKVAPNGDKYIEIKIENEEAFDMFRFE